MVALTDRQHARFAHKVARQFEREAPGLPFPRGWREVCRATLDRCPRNGANETLQRITAKTLTVVRKHPQGHAYYGAVAAVVFETVQRWPTLRARELAQ